MTSPKLSPPEFLARLHELTQGLYYLSESDYPLEDVHFNLPAGETLSESYILERAGQQKNVPCTTEELHHFFRNMVKEAIVGEEMAARFKALQAFLEQHLNDIKVYRVGERTVQAFVLGKLATEELAGIKTTVIQT